MIRCARKEDLPKIAHLHFECFPDSFSTVLGKGQKGRLLENYYYEYLSKVPELFLVSENDNKEINGLCMGYYCDENNCLRKFLKHNFFAICLRMIYLLVTGNKEAWKKLITRGKNHNTDIINEKIKEYGASQKGDLLSICVKSECRGSNVATDLVREFVSVLQKNNREVCVLSVKTENARAIRFYNKMGFSCYMKSESGLYLFKPIK